MTSLELLSYIGDIDPKFVAQASVPVRKKSGIARFAAIAAAFVLILGLGGIYLNSMQSKSAVEDPPPTVSDTAVKKTSDRFSSLDELLSYLSGNEKHSSDGAAGVQKSVSRGITEMYSADFSEGSTAVSYMDYSYHISQGSVIISKLNSGSAESAGQLPANAQKLYICGDKLIILSLAESGGEIDYEYTACLDIYSLSDPAQPEFIHSVTQTGEIVGAFISGSRFILITSDGECACGFSRLDDKSKYIPSINCAGTELDISDDSTHILGTPTRVQYAAVCTYDIGDNMSASVNGIYYGDISQVFYGADFMAIMTHTEGYSNEFYFFSGREYLYAGKLSADNIAENFSLTNITYSNSSYKLTGMQYRTGTENSDTFDGRITAADVSEDLASISVGYGQWLSSLPEITEITLDSDRQIVCLSTYDNIFTNDLTISGHFAIIDFSGGISVYEPAAAPDYLDGIENIFSMGRPYGEFETMISMGSGIYLRYRGSPDSLDIYDFSGESVTFFTSVYSLPDADSYCYRHCVLSDSLIAVISISPTVDKYGDLSFRNPECRINLYSVNMDTDEKVRLISQYECGSYESVEFFNANGQIYFVSDLSDVPIVIKQ